MECCCACPRTDRMARYLIFDSLRDRAREIGTPSPVCRLNFVRRGGASSFGNAPIALRAYGAVLLSDERGQADEQGNRNAERDADSDQSKRHDQIENSRRDPCSRALREGPRES